MNKALNWVQLFLVAAGVIAIAAVAISVVHSFDVFWQLQSGRYMVETGEVIRNDLFTLAADAPRVEHCWLHDIILYLVYQIGSYAGLSLWKGLTISVGICLILVTALLRGSSLLAMLLVLPLSLLTSGGWLERPQIWSFLMTGLTLLILEIYRQRPGRVIYLLFPVALIWANLHAGSVLILPLYLAYLAGNLLDNLVRQRKFRIDDWPRFVGGGALLVVGAQVTPYSMYWLRTLRAAPGLGASVDSSGERSGPMTQLFNMDWTPTSFALDPIFFYILAVTALVLLLTLKRLRGSDLFLLVGLAVMGLSLIRHIPFFYLAAMIVLPRYLDMIGAWLSRYLGAGLQLAGKVALAAMAVYGFWTVYQPLYQIYGFFNTGLRSWHYPIKATDFLVEHKLAPNLYNTYDWGGYLAWRLYPQYRVFWDGRQNSAEMFRLGWNVMAGKPDWAAILDQFRVNTILTRSLTIDTGQKYPLLDRLVADPQWNLVFNAEASMVFVRETGVDRSWLLKHRRPKALVDDSILTETHLMLGTNPNRYMAWWEMAQIYYKRRQFKEARMAVEQHLMRAPRPVGPARDMLNRLLQMGV